MPIPTTIDDLSQTAASNSPAGSDSPVDGDNFLRAHASFIAILRDKLDGTDASGTIKQPVFSGTATGTLVGAYLTAATLVNPTFSGLTLDDAAFTGTATGLYAVAPTLDDAAFLGTATGLYAVTPTLDDPALMGTATGAMSYAALQTFVVGVNVGNVAQAGANTLDWYEEGTFTPGVSFGAATTGIIYAIQDGVFTRIGNTVHFRALVNLTSKGSATGDARLTGLPYTVGKDAPFSIFATNLASLTGAPAVFSESASTNIVFYQSNSAGHTSLDNTNFTNNTTIYVAGYYRV